MDDVAFFAALDEKLQVGHINPWAILLQLVCLTGNMGVHQLHAAMLYLLERLS